MKKSILPLSRVAIAIAVLGAIASSSAPSLAGGPRIEWHRFISHEKMPESGKFKGEDVENKQRRALILLRPSEKRAFGIPADQLAFANFRDHKKFYVAVLPGIHVDEDNNATGTDDVVSSVELLEKHWAEKVRPETASVEVHTEMNFLLAKGQEIVLVADQDEKKILETPIKLDQVVLSIESVRSEEHPNAPFIPDALRPNLAIAYRIESDNERDVQHQEDDPDRVEKTDKLNLAGKRSKLAVIPAVGDAILYNAIKKSAKLGRKQTYDIARNNCTNNLFKLLDESINYPNGIDVEKIRASALSFTQKDLPVILAYLEKQQAGAVAQDPTFAPIQKMVMSMMGKLGDQVEKMEVGPYTLASLPAVLEGHLKARDLL